MASNYSDPYTSALGKMKAGTQLSGLTPAERRAVQDESEKMRRFKEQSDANRTADNADYIIKSLFTPKKKKRDGDIELPNESGQRDPRLAPKTPADAVKSMVNGALKKAILGK